MLTFLVLHLLKSSYLIRPCCKEHHLLRRPCGPVSSPLPTLIFFTTTTPPPPPPPPTTPALAFAGLIASPPLTSAFDPTIRRILHHLHSTTTAICSLPSLLDHQAPRLCCLHQPIHLARARVLGARLGPPTAESCGTSAGAACRGH
ncbi:hypothetical protein IWX46DRAFT_593214 [Phyllosticta citricarpa]|uniref:Uncharacterized protein n=1 Tax=Phyllosticta citricarpa TaxID=55181 RepID=A0ABR1MKI2_9PEZI